MPQRTLKRLVFTACLLPLVFLAWRAATFRLGANPIAAITDATGTWTLRFLLLTLAVTPVRRLTGWNVVIGYRRMLGLFAFFYGVVHLSTYVVLDQFFALDLIAKDIAKRPFITVGMAALLLMVPLALTSTAASIRRLGGKAWRRLHRLAYASVAAGVVHYYWLVKADTSRPLRYAAVLALLFAIRAWFWAVPKPAGRVGAATTASAERAVP